MLKIGTVICCDKVRKGNNKITELRTILQRESQNSVNNRKTVTTQMHYMIWIDKPSVQDTTSNDPIDWNT